MRPHILVVEDQILTQQEIAATLSSAGFHVLEMLESGESALSYLHKVTTIPDLILMDIKLAGQLNGIETAQKINQKYRVPIIYLTDLTAHEYFAKAKETFPKHYLTKPFLPHQLTYTVELALTKTGGTTDPAVLQQHGFFATKDGAVKIAYDEIEYMHASGQYCDIFLKDGNKYSTSYPMKEVLKKIPDANILRISRSCCINLQMVDSIDGNLVRIGTNSFTIGETYRDEVKSMFNLF